MFSSQISGVHSNATHEELNYARLSSHGIEKLYQSPIGEEVVRELEASCLIKLSTEPFEGYCTDFALKDTNIVPQVVRIQPLSHLKTLQYENVTAPRNGDLVLYFREENFLTKSYSTRFPITIPLVEHLGIWNDGRVESKWGGISSSIVHHNINIIPISYGDSCTFFRKNL